MYSYSVSQWVIFFYIYCVFGWCIESTYVSVKTRKITNRGFMRGPWLPIYGSGAIVMLICSIPFAGNIPLTFIAGMIGASVLEFLTGMAMEALFKVRYWDYSNRRFNIKGHVCLGNSIAWGVLTVLLTQIIHKPVSELVVSIPQKALEIVTTIWTLIIVADFALAFKVAIDLRNILVQVERAKEELSHIKKRLDVVIAVTADEINAKKESAAHKIDGMMESIENTFEKSKEFILHGKAESVSMALKDEVDELRIKYATLKGKLSGLWNIKGFLLKSQLRGNPTMKSLEYEDAFESIKNSIAENNNKK